MFQPKARILEYAHAGVRPEFMGIGPLTAVENLLQRTDLCTHEFDVIQGSKALGVDASKVTPTGGAIASGHSLGATGVVITIKPILSWHVSDGQKRRLQCLLVGIRELR